MKQRSNTTTDPPCMSLPSRQREPESCRLSDVTWWSSTEGWIHHFIMLVCRRLLFNVSCSMCAHILSEWWQTGSGTRRRPTVRLDFKRFPSWDEWRSINAIKRIVIRLDSSVSSCWGENVGGNWEKRRTETWAPLLPRRFLCCCFSCVTGKVHSHRTTKNIWTCWTIQTQILFFYLYNFCFEWNIIRLL